MPLSVFEQELLHSMGVPLTDQELVALKQVLGRQLGDESSDA